MARFNGVPADLAQRGDCAGAKRAVSSMRPGLAQDYEAERVAKACGLNSNEGTGEHMGSLRWLDTALKKNSRSKGYKYKVVCPAHGPRKKTTVTKSIHKKKSAAVKAAKKLARGGWWKGCRVVKY
jgi:hypothetical protein